MPGYLFKQESIAITGVESLQIRSLLDRQQFADPLGEAEALGISSAFWPLFGLIWPSGLHLAEAMGQRLLREDESILEIGCGLGLASLVAHRRGALVTASDCHPLAAAFMLENLRLNELPPLRYCHGNWAPFDAQAIPSQRVPRVQGRFDLIMGSDILYERDGEGALPQFIARHALPRSEVIIIDPNRGNRSAFSKRMALLGYRLEETVLKSAPEAEAYSGRLLRYWRE
ncbi:SAM-dependent methyltransferase [Paucibacter sp. KBW04]|uniref:class I SAM-dependent methyltransferase n=1 Tax=Paucibacter sp. KBW04 TaxID=2153361 RepID=UPI000F56DEB1|nr:50S ribosomal protein L11 methyltransferase [Paucibacter sp. KBW04]RQO59726.1 SAM-dependent methyltransferase [Paucibacter sp. KBW04]